MSKRAGFTLVEMMIIVAILTDIMIIAIPSFIRARTVSQNTSFIGGLRTATSAFEMYSAENNRYPADAALGVVPSGMSVYLNGFDWSRFTPIGGRWDWIPSSYGSTAMVGVVYTTATAPDTLRMTDIDTRMDNGVLTTGGFRRQSSTVYTHLIE